MRVFKITVPPDKSISHRAIMLASISEGITRINNFLMAEDTKRTIDAFRAMGVKLAPCTVRGASLAVHGVGMRGLRKPRGPLYLGNSGTTMRILPGILAGQGFSVTLKGDSSLSFRPMLRIAGPLHRMGAEVLGRTKESKSGTRARPGQPSQKEIFPPLKIRGGRLKPIRYTSKIASAQVKSCILLAGLYANGITSVTEPVKSRDHTERMLGLFGARLRARGLKCSVIGPARLKSPGVVEVPADISSAAFLMVAGCILPDTKIILKSVGLNPTRTGILDILTKMGACIRITNEEPGAANCEPRGDIIVKSSKLRGVMISPRETARAIDEMPIIMVAASLAKGKTVIKGIEELRVKETDRARSMVSNLQKLGARISIKTFLKAKGRAEVIIINGGSQLYGASVHSYGDHRTAMSMLIAGLVTKGEVKVSGLSSINKSFPGFRRILKKIS